MAGKRGLIMGVANNRSIAWGIAQACANAGAELAFTYQGDALKKRVEPLAAELGAKMVVPCDVTDMASLDATFATIEKEWGKLDFVVHAIAFSDKDELDGRYVDTTAENFTKTMFISCYSFTAVAQRADKLMKAGGSLLTLTYYGAEKWMPHYNVMGVEIGEGFASAALSGEDNADEIRMKDGKPEFLTNKSGGVLGGISSGQDIVLRFAVKPTSSILTPRRSITAAGEETDVMTKGRHDPCVGIRAVPVGEAMMALVLADHFLRHRGQVG